MDNRIKDSFDTVVIGGGQAGLAMGYFLTQQKCDFVILEASSRGGTSWRSRWDSLHLNTPAKFSYLPGMAFPTAGNAFPSKDETAQYLEDYAEHFQLPIAFNTPVQSLSRSGGRFRLTAGGRELEVDHVVVATGAFHKPKFPPFAAALDPAIRQIHSSQYHNPGQLQDGSVLVVGAGNSGLEIAMELGASSRQVWLSGKDNGRIPISNSLPLVGNVFWWVINKKLTADSRVGRKVRAKLLAGGGDPLIGISLKMADQAGVTRVGRTESVQDCKPVVAGGQLLDVQNVVWATGAGPDYNWIHLPVFDEKGLPVHQRGAVPSAPGLYFLGLRFQYALASTLLGGVGADAAYLAGRIGAESGAHQPYGAMAVQIS